METGRFSPRNTAGYPKAHCLVTTPLTPAPLPPPPPPLLALQNAKAAVPGRAEQAAKPPGSGTSPSNQATDQIFTCRCGGNRLHTSLPPSKKGNKKKRGRHRRSEPRRQAGPCLPALLGSHRLGSARPRQPAPTKPFRPSWLSKNVVVSPGLWLERAPYR